jgi:hypothetical protein
MTKEQPLEPRLRSALQAAARAHPLPADFASSMAPTLPDRRRTPDAVLRFILPSLAAAAFVLAVAALAVVLSLNQGPTSGGGPHPTPSDSGSASATVLGVVSTSSGVSFNHPADWHVVQPLIAVRPGPLFFVSNASTQSNCPSQGVCVPVGQLPANGVLLIVSTSAVLSPGHDAPAVQIAQSPYCAGLGADRILAARRLGLSITGCFRGPDLATSESAFRAFLESMRRVD